MILSVHMLVGAAIGSKVKNYWAIFIYSILAHFILDLLPHWEYLSESQTLDQSNLGFLLLTIKALGDLMVGSLIILWLFRSSPLLKRALFGAFFALLPDGLIFLYLLSHFLFSWVPPVLQYFYSLHDVLHFKERDGLLFWKIPLELLSFFLAGAVIAKETNKFPSLTKLLLTKNQNLKP